MGERESDVYLKFNVPVSKGTVPVICALFYAFKRNVNLFHDIAPPFYKISICLYNNFS